MKRKNTVLVILLTCLVFLSAALLGVSSVYRIDEVTLKPTVISAAAKEETAELQQRLQKAYEKQSTFSVKKAEAEEIMKEFPYFRMTSFKKVYPNLIVVKVTEDKEMFAVPAAETENAYYIVSKDGVVLGIRNSYENRFDGANNLLIKGLTVTGKQGETLLGDGLVAPLLRFCEKADELLGGIRRNVVSIEVLRMTSDESDTMIRVNTQEGVKIYVRNVADYAEDKAKTAFEKYLSLTDVQRMEGRIAVSGQSGVTIATYSQEDEFDVFS
ncbi:MAG: hypothetical protein IJX87_06295 [Clostridia bacterium]|nr:hypothetical protein [Clostridia bacterium]